MRSHLVIGGRDVEGAPRSTRSRSVHSRRTDPIKRSTYPFCQGEWNEVGRSSRALNAPSNALALSPMRYLVAVSRGNASVIWRASHSAIGFSRTTTGAAVDGQEMRIAAERHSSYKEINRCNLLHVIAKEILPALQWPTLPRHHVYRNRGLRIVRARCKIGMTNLLYNMRRLVCLERMAPAAG